MKKSISLNRSRRSERKSQTYNVDLIYQDFTEENVRIDITRSGNTHKKTESEFLEGVDMTSSVGDIDTSRGIIQNENLNGSENDLLESSTPLMRKSMGLGNSEDKMVTPKRFMEHLKAKKLESSQRKHDGKIQQHHSRSISREEIDSLKLSTQITDRNKESPHKQEQKQTKLQMDQKKKVSGSTVLRSKVEELELMLQRKDSYLRKLKKEKQESVKEIMFLKEQNLIYNTRADESSYGSPDGLYTYIEQGSKDHEDLDFTKEDEIEGELETTKSINHAVDQ